MSKKEILQGIRELIRDPAHWTRGVIARDAAGREVLMTSPQAVAFCLSGALHRFEATHPGTDVMGAVWQPLMEMIHHRYKCPMPEFNDTHSHAEVLAVLDEAISAQE